MIKIIIMANKLEENIKSLTIESLKGLLLRGLKPSDETVLLEKELYCSLHIDGNAKKVNKDILAGLYQGWDVQYEKELTYYRDNLFSRADEINSVIMKSPNSRKLYFNFWSQNDNDLSVKSPCLVGLDFRVLQDSKLDMHVIMRANNAFKIFPMNLVIFVSFFIEVSKKVNLSPNVYHHYTSLFHLYKEDMYDLKNSNYFSNALSDEIRLI